ncbi:hypothetical protein V6N11_010951 [Hibiscus sabdariffa]|uniref:Secreted protein n=1 Tax=Hibiscus sabdariffa TaxID=183260 RepID=A0ABR2S6W3_9ROSI
MLLQVTFVCLGRTECSSIFIAVFLPEPPNADRTEEEHSSCSNVFVAAEVQLWRQKLSQQPPQSKYLWILEKATHFTD